MDERIFLQESPADQFRLCPKSVGIKTKIRTINSCHTSSKVTIDWIIELKRQKMEQYFARLHIESILNYKKRDIKKLNIFGGNLVWINEKKESWFGIYHQETTSKSVLSTFSRFQIISLVLLCLLGALCCIQSCIICANIAPDPGIDTSYPLITIYVSSQIQPPTYRPSTIYSTSN